MLVTSIRSILLLSLLTAVTVGLINAQKVHDSAYEAGAPTVGDQVPNVDLISTEGSTYSLKNLIEGKKSIIVLYRGGWCPYCTTQMSGLAKAQKEIRAQGFQIIGVTGEDLSLTNKFSNEHELPYKIFTDEGITLAKKLNVAYKVDAATLKKYKSYGIDIPGGILPIPTLIAVNESGIIEYVYANPDYKVRIPAEELLTKLTGLNSETDKK